MSAVKGTSIGGAGGVLLLSLLVLLGWNAGAQAAVSYQSIYLASESHYMVLQAGPGNRVSFHVEPQYVADSAAYAYNVYEAKGKVTGKRIRANLPGMGKVDLRFKPTERRRKASRPYECTGKPGSRMRGTLRGIVRLRDGTGDNAISFRIKTGSGNGKLRSTAYFNRRINCWYDDERIEDYLDTSNLLVLRAGEPDGTREVVALRENYAHATDALLFATHKTTFGNLKVTRVIATEGNGSVFPATPDLASASLNPFSPFLGSADFARTGPDSGTWAGSLAGWFLARPDTPLAGAPMTANVGSWADIMDGYGGIPLAIAVSPEPVGAAETLRRITK